MAILKCFPAPGDSPILTIYVDVSDEALLAEICEGSREALAALFRRYARIVRGVAFRDLQDASEADDLLQDIFLLIHWKSAGSALQHFVDRCYEARMSHGGKLHQSSSQRPLSKS